MIWNDNLKSVFNFIIRYQDGAEVDLHDEDLWVESFRILSASADYVTSKVDARNGEVNQGSTTNPRTINAMVQINGYDPSDFDLYRDEVFNIFRPGEEIEIIRDMQPGKKIVCVVDGDFDIDYESCEDGRFDVSFTMFYPFLQSVKTTADLDGGLKYGDGWYYGMGLIYDDSIYKYTNINDSNFEIYNAGNVSIHPFEQDLKITIEGASKGYELKNETTGDVFKITDDVSGKVVLNRANITNDGSQFLRSTNRKYISLSKKINKFTQNQNAKVSFDFPFYYY